MSLITSRISLVHRAVIQRAETTTDEYNTDGIPTWNDYLTDLPCRLWAMTGRQSGTEQVVDQASLVAIEDLRMLVPVDTDVTADDQVGAVSWRGSVIHPGPTQIRAVLRRPTHLELVLVSTA